MFTRVKPALVLGKTSGSTDQCPLLACLKEHFIRLLISTCSLRNVLQLQWHMVLLGDTGEKPEGFMQEGVSGSCPSVI